MKTKKMVLLLALTVLLLTACQGAAKDNTDNANTKKKEHTKQAASQEFADLKVEKSDGTAADIEIILSQAELTVFHVWEPSCESCKKEMKILGGLENEYAGRGVQIVGVIKGVSDAGNKQALADIAESGTNYIQLLDSKELKQRLTGDYDDTPFTVMVGRDGTQLGEVNHPIESKDQWKTEIEKYHSSVCVNDHPADSGAG